VVEASSWAATWVGMEASSAWKRKVLIAWPAAPKARPKQERDILEYFERFAVADVRRGSQLAPWGCVGADCVDLLLLGWWRC